MNSHFRQRSNIDRHIMRSKLKNLRVEEKRFMLALKDLNSNEAMRAFCERGLATIRIKIAQLEGLI